MLQAFSVQSANHDSYFWANCARHWYLRPGINRKFIPLRAPHFGLWPVAVKLAKFHIHRVVGDFTLAIKELRTLAYGISAILNSRPLWPISENPESIEVLTPSFLSLTSLFFAKAAQADGNRWSRCKNTPGKDEATSTCPYCKKGASGASIRFGSIVLGKENNIPPSRWMLGRIPKVIPGGTAS